MAASLLATAAPTALSLARTLVDTATAATRRTGQQTQAQQAQQGHQARNQAREFESVFLSQVLNTMTTSLSDRTGFDGGHAEAQWRSIMNEHMGRQIAANGGVGVADAVQRELLRAQEARLRQGVG